MSNRRFVLCHVLAAMLLLPGPFAHAAKNPKASAARVTRINPKDSSVMVYVPAGPFLMGDADQSDNPRRTVTLNAFWIYKNDVTVAQYRKFCKTTGRAMPRAPYWGWMVNQPVVNVTWDDAKDYCDWAGAALPTEAQWEKAARGTDGRQYPWGNKWDPWKLWCSVSKIGWETAPVGCFPAGASPYGCLDMAGNVVQWCADWYADWDHDNFPKNSPGTSPTGPATGKFRVLRGGSGGNTVELSFRCGVRSYAIPEDRLFAVGFRCVVRADR